MPSSPIGFLAEILSGGSLPVTGRPIGPGELAYFRERLKGRVFSLIARSLRNQQLQNPNITQAEVARRLGRRPEQITRWLSGPSNMTLDTISDLVLAISGGEPGLGVSPLTTNAPADASRERVEPSFQNSVTGDLNSERAMEEIAAVPLGGPGVKGFDGQLLTPPQPAQIMSPDAPLGSSPDWGKAANNNQRNVDQSGFLGVAGGV